LPLDIQTAKSVWFSEQEELHRADHVQAFWPCLNIYIFANDVVVLAFGQADDPQEDTEMELGENAGNTSEIVHESSQKPTGEENIEEDVEQADEFRELPTPPQLPSTTEENQDDILEIQTSLDDVRQLHTPSSRFSTPKPPLSLLLVPNEAADR